MFSPTFALLSVSHFLWLRESLKDVVVRVTRAYKCYDISATKVLESREVQTPTMFDCELRIPDANYAVRRSIVYYPGEQWFLFS
jgi:hypothetical protein